MSTNATSVIPSDEQHERHEPAQHEADEAAGRKQPPARGARRLGCGDGRGRQDPPTVPPCAF